MLVVVLAAAAREGRGCFFRYTSFVSYEYDAQPLPSLQGAISSLSGQNLLFKLGVGSVIFSHRDTEDTEAAHTWERITLCSLCLCVRIYFSSHRVTEATEAAHYCFAAVR